MISDHSRKRMKQRKINKNQVIRNILSLEIRLFEEMRKTGIDLMVIDVRYGFTIVISMNKKQIIIKTVIDKATEIYIKPYIRTKVYILHKEQ